MRHKNHSLFKIPCLLIVLIISILLMTVVSCDKTTKAKTGSLSGQVVLLNDTENPSLDPVDYSGITVALYELADLDTTVVRINQEYPNIGIHIGQETEFDHRLQNPVAVVTSDATGNFTFKKIPIGDYNLVAFKEGWSVLYLHKQAVANTNKDSYLLGDSGSIIEQNVKAQLTLYPALVLPSMISSEYVFKENHLYLINQDLIALSDVIMEGGAQIALGEGVRADFHGKVTFNDNSKYVKFFSRDSIHTSAKAQGPLYHYDKVSFLGTYDYVVKTLIIEQLMNGLVIRGGASSVENCIFRKSGSLGLEAQGSMLNVENSLFMNNGFRGLTVSTVLHLSNSVLYRNEEACHMNRANSTINNNYWSDNKKAVKFLMGEHSIIHNVFDRNVYTLSPSASNPYIAYNEFYKNSHDIETNAFYIEEFLYCNPQVEYNNFFQSVFYVHLVGRNVFYDDVSSQLGVNQNQLYPNNYLKAANLTSHVYDTNYPGSTIGYSVSFIPRRNIKIVNAGILP